MESQLSATLGIVLGLILLVMGGELLVRGASKLAATLRISPLVIGLTVVAFGTSSPEFSVTLQSVLLGKADIALGNVLGSNIFNVLFILGASALITPLTVTARLVRFDVPIMVVASAAVAVLGLDGAVSRFDGALLVSGLVVYTGWCVRQGRAKSDSQPGAEDSAEVSSAADKVPVQVALLVAGLALLGVGSRLLVSGAVTVATALGVSELIIGLTIVAVGTSLPEVVTSLVAALRGERDIAVGNVVGSNLFNTLGVLGLASALSASGVAVPAAALRFDIPVMVASAFACLPISSSPAT